MQAALKERIVYNHFLLLFILFPFISAAQLQKESFDLFIDQVARPIRMEIRSYITKADKIKLNCDLTFFSINFVINTHSFTCDTVMLSKSVDKELAQSISNLIKESKIEWSTIVKSIDHCNKEKLQLIFPVFISRDKCDSPKLTAAQWWEIFNKSIIEGKREVILIGSMGMHMSH
jgi:hypothetical protein